MFTFNDNYDDLDQVKPFYAQFKKIKDTIEGIAYNSLFTGKIPGIAGEHESKAIFLLQHLDTEYERQTKIKYLLANGYKPAQPQEGGMEKFASVVKVGNDNSRAGFNEYPGGKIWYADKKMYIVPKHNRTRGFFVWPDSLVFVK